MEPSLLLAPAALVLAIVSAVLWVRLRRARGQLGGVAVSLGPPTPTPDELVGRLRSILDAAASSQARADEREADLASLIEGLEVGVVVVDSRLIVVTANPAAHQLLGRRAGRMAGRPLLEATLEPRLEDLVASSRPDRPAREELDVGGGHRLAATVATGPRGIRWLLLHDVSELTRLRRIRAEFLDNLSHELRTPVTTIGILAESLSLEAEATGTPLPDRVRDRISKIEVETGHLGQMVAELLDLARVESGVGIELYEDVDLGRVALLAVDRMRPLAEQEGVQLEVDVPGDPVPPVRGDADRLGQVVVNLLHNALKFSGPEGQVSVRVWPTAEEVSVSVRDEGIGISAADQARIFERFYKADRARSRAGGTGLGLSIAQDIVEAHGGRISVESAPGEGSTFTFVIPVTAAPGRDGPPQP